MRAYRTRILLAGLATVAACSAQAFQFSTLSTGTYTVATLIDSEAVQFSYYNGVTPIPVTTLVLDGNTNMGVLAGPSNVDQMNFAFQPGTLQSINGSINQQVSWQYVSGTGAFANLTGLGSLSIDAQFVNGVTYQTTTGLTGELVATPEPASLAALGIGAAAFLRRRRKA